MRPLSTAALAAAALACTCVSSADILPGYETLDEAAVAALSYIIPLSDDSEYGGALLQIHGLFTFTSPITDNSYDSVAIRYHVPEGGKLVGLYHTHPCDPRNLPNIFSSVDVKTATAAHIRSYIAVVCTQEIRVFDPATMPTHIDKALIGNGRVADGMHLKGIH